MHMIRFPTRAPMAVLFFIGSAVALYYSEEVPALERMAASAFCFSMALGPIRWIENRILAIPWPFSDGEGRMTVGNEDVVWNFVRVVSKVSQVVFLSLGVLLWFGAACAS